jgi:putative membrane protein
LQTSFALSLLMLFKTSSSYARWWECRILWGTGYIHIRQFMRLVIAYVGRDNPELVAPLYRWNCAWLPALAAFMRGKVRPSVVGLAPMAVSTAQLHGICR